MSLSSSDVQQIDRQIRALAMRAGCKEADLDDVAQEAFVNLLSRPSFMELERENGRRGAAIRSATLRAMKTIRNQQSPETSINPDTRLGPAPDPAQVAEEREEQETMLARLDPRDREIAEMFLDGYTQAEVAAKLGLTRQAVQQHMEKLRGELSQTRNVIYKT